MRLVNTTPYNDKDLKGFVYTCAKELRGGRKLCKDLTIRFQGKHLPEWVKEAHKGTSETLPKRGVSGLAYLSKVYHSVGLVRGSGHQTYGYLITIRIPVDNTFTKRELAHVIIHELMHCQGHNHWAVHKLERRYDYGWKSEALAFADNLPLNLKVEVPKPQRNVRAERHEQAKKMVVEYTAKVKRYQNLLKKWQKKVKYYEGN